MTQRNIEGTNIHLEYCFLSGFEKHIVSIYMNGEFYDHHEFDTFSEAESYMNDPFKEERNAAKREAAREAARIAESDAMAARNASLIGCNRGRQVGPNKRGSI
jgi:hypothetical protein